MDVFPKFIIEDNKIITGKVTYHRDLSENVDNVVGGGWFMYNSEDHSFTLYGTSDQFGRVDESQIKKALVETNIFGYGGFVEYVNAKIFYCYELGLEKIQLK